LCSFKPPQKNKKKDTGRSFFFSQQQKKTLGGEAAGWPCAFVLALFPFSLWASAVNKFLTMWLGLQNIVAT